jgi:hypothetical protein
MYDDGKYSPKQIREGLERLERQVDKIKTNGGVLLLDTQRVIMEKKMRTTMSKWLKKRKWKSFFKCYDVEAFRYTPEDGDGIPRIILVHRPLCWAFYSGEDKKAYEERGYTSQSRRAKSAQFLLYVVRFIQPTDDDLPKYTGEVDETIWGDFLVAFAMRIFLIENLHMNPKAATLFSKNMIHRYLNLFKEVYHGMAISDYGFNKKQQERNRRKPNAKQVDNDYLKRMINSLSIKPNLKDGVIEEVLQEVEKYTGEKDVLVERFITTYKINLLLGNCIKESYNNWMRAGDEHAFENARKKEAERANILQQRRS